MGQKLTQEKIDRIIQMLADGEKGEYIARVCGVSYTTVYRIDRRHIKYGPRENYPDGECPYCSSCFSCPLDDCGFEPKHNENSIGYDKDLLSELGDLPK